MANIRRNNTVIHANVVNKRVTIKSNITQIPYATTEIAGKIRIATLEETQQGTDNSTAITPYTLKNVELYSEGTGINIINKVISINDSEIATQSEVDEINNTLATHGNIVTHDVSEFATASQGEKADTALQPNDNISQMTNDAGYISGITSLDVTTALGYTPYNDTNPNNYQENVLEKIKVNNTEQTITSKTVNIIVPTQASDVGALPNSTKYGSSIELSINSSTYVITLNLKDQDGTVLNSDTIDLPLESVVVGGSYDDTTKKVILTLENGSTIEFSVADLVSGLQSEITGAASTITNNNLTFNKAVISNGSGKIAVSSVTTTELEYLSGVTGAIQTQINNKQDTISDLIDIRSGANAGSTAIQPNDDISLLNNDINFIKNNATGVNSIAVGDNSQSTAEGSVSVGDGARANSTYSTAIGQNTRATNTNTVAIGKQAKATEARAIAIGSGAEANAQDAIAIKGINNTANTLQVYTYTMLDMSTGLIPDGRISSNIARTVNIPTDTADLTNGAGFISSINSTDVTTALGYTPYDSNNPNGYTANVGTVTSVNNTNPDSNGNVTISIPAEQVQVDWNETNTSSKAYILNKPNIPSGVIVDQSYDSTSTNAQSGTAVADAISTKADSSSLSTVATSGSYDDLTDKPTIPSAQINSDWNANSGVAEILNKPTLSTVATSGSYNDLSNKPTIPTVNNATLTIQKNGTNVQTFTANASSDVTANITVPTDVSELTNTSLANVSLSNLNTTGENRLYALKGYNDNGQILSDNILYNYIKSCYHNSFDLSKFTLVGTPTITDDGIASGFSTSNYLSIASSFTLGTDFELYFPFVLTDKTTETQIYRLQSGGTFRGLVTFTPSYGVMVNLSDGTYNMSDGGNKFAITDEEIITNKKYIIVIKQHNQTCSYGYIADGIYTEKGTIENFALNMPLIDTTYIGRGNSGAFTGSIDLKQFSITVNGTEVFSGNKTGTDTYYTDDYTVVGSPTITDGVASGFSTSNYLTSGNFKQNLGQADTWEIEMFVTTPSSWTTRSFLIGGETVGTINYGIPHLYFGTSKKLVIDLSSDGTNPDIANQKVGTDTYSDAVGLGIRFEFTGTQYLVYSKLSGEDWKLQTTVNNSNKIYSSNFSYIFGQQNSGSTLYYRGSININSIRIFANDKLVYTPYLAIPYTKTDNGLKIANADYRKDIVLVNDTYGYSPYFTIDTTNQNTTLPMPDLYSIINQSTPDYLKNITGYDGTTTQTLKQVNGVFTWVTDTP